MTTQLERSLQTDPVKQLAWDLYGDAVRRWRLDKQRTPKPRAAWQIGRHIASLPVEANPAGRDVPAVRTGAAA